MKLLWLSSLSCYGNVHSLMNYPHIEKFLNDFEFIYHPSFEGNYSLNDVISKDLDCDILIIDGTLQDDLLKADVPIKDVIFKYGKKAKKIVAVGTCASFGGIFLNDEDSKYGLHFRTYEQHNRYEQLKEKTINISGCPVQPEVFVNTLYFIKKQYPIKLDKFLRPKEYYGYTIHNGCTRNEYFEYKVDSAGFGNLEGCLYYNYGCQAPYTNGSCNKLLWNETSSKTRVGHPCMGCTEPSFPKTNLFETKKNMGIPQTFPLDVSKRAYLTIAGVAKAFTIDRLNNKIME